MPDFHKPPREAVDTMTTLDRLSLIADDIGRLRRMGHEGHVLDRVADNVETLDAMLRPTASRLYREMLIEGHEADAAVRAALTEVDADSARMRHRLGAAER